MTCEICGSHLVFSWTDTHGVGQCRTCGAPYVLLHYEGEGADRKRVDGKPPELAVAAPYVSALRRYWAEAKRLMPSGYSFTGYGTNYERASAADARDFYDWLERDPECQRLRAGSAAKEAV